MNNTTAKTNFRFDIPDNRLSETFQWQVQGITFPSVSLETARVTKSPKLANTAIAGTATNFDDLEITFLMDEDLKAYSELLSWMMTVQNPTGPTTEKADNVPQTALLHVMDNTKEKIVSTFKFYKLYPKTLGSLEWTYTESGDIDMLTCTVTFGYMYFDMLLPDGRVISPR